MTREPRTWPLARPDLDGFELAGSRATPCLLLHGFTAAPLEVRPLAEALSGAGFPVHAPLLPGHGTHVEDLAAAGPDTWVQAAEAELAALVKARGGPVCVAGQSMGALLGLILAARHPAEVRAVATLAAPLWFHDVRARLLVPLFRWTPFLDRAVRFVPKRPSQLPEERRAAHFTYDRFPVRGVVGLGALMKLAARALPAVRAPLLVLHGALDPTAPPLSARRIIARAGSETKVLVELARSRHTLTLDVESELVCARVVEFFAAHAS